MELKEQKPQFCAVLTPHRALDQKGVYVVMIITCILAAIPGVVFFLMGAWPIIGFLGLDVALLFWALSKSRQEVNSFEEITLYTDKLDIRSVSPKGRVTRHQFNPFWIKIEVLRDFEDRVTDIVLKSKERTIKVGAFLNPEDKKSFAFALSCALYRVKR